MWDLLFYIFLIALVAVLIVIGGVIVRGYLNGGVGGASFFGPKPDPRIAVIEQANVDGRRRLLLIQRDDVEHLIMTGGPVDVVIETGIDPRRKTSLATVPAATPAFERQPRGFGQRANDG